MTEKEQKKAAAAFTAEWAGKGDEKQDTHRFWIGFLRKVLGVENADERIVFEKPVKYKGHTTFIDAYIMYPYIVFDAETTNCLNNRMSAIEKHNPNQQINNIV